MGTRLADITACSISVALVKESAVASSAPSTIWPRPGFAALDQGGERAERAMQRGAEIDPVHRRPVRRIALAGHVHRARHHLANAVETDAVGPRPRPAERGCRGQDDVRLDRLQRFIIELHRPQRLRRQIGDDDVGCRHQPAHHLLAFRLHRIERDAFLVAVDLQEQRALAAFADGRDKAILAAVAFLHANDFRAELRQQGRAIWPRDIAPEIEDANALQNSPHRSFPCPCWLPGSWRSQLIDPVVRSVCHRASPGQRAFLRFLMTSSGFQAASTWLAEGTNPGIMLATCQAPDQGAS